MEHRFVNRQGNTRLILIFAGWGMDSKPFAHISRPGYDTLVLWDYRSLAIDWSIVAPYTEIALIAWSMGVYAASVSTHAIDHLITAKIAVNGTLWPVHNLLGIPTQVFQGTAQTLNERNLAKFHRRMCGNRATTQHFLAAAPVRTIPGLIHELHAIHPEPLLSNPRLTRWDRAIIGRDDAIFPPCNQQRAWAGTPIVVVDRPHYIDLQEIASAYIIDKQQTAQRFESGRQTYSSHASVQAQVVTDLVADIHTLRLLPRLAAPGNAILEIGPGSGLLSHHLAKIAPKAHLHLWDLNTTPPQGIPHTAFISCDAETQICRTPSARFDAIASSSTIQWFNSPSRFLRECLRTLRPGGLLLLTAFCRGNMHELHTAAAVSLHLPTPEQWRQLIPSGLETLSLETHNFDLAFPSPLHVLRHLKLTGVNSLSRPQESPTATAHQFLNRYPRRLDGLCHLSYNTIRIILQKK